MASKFRNFLIELKRRRVYTVAAGYAVTGWVMAMGAAELFPYFGIPEWAVRLIVIAAVLGFPVAVVLAWAYEVTPEGVVRDSDARAIYAADSNATQYVAPTAICARVGDDQNSFEQTFSSDFKIGRDELSDLRIDDGRVSRHHARVFWEADSWWLEDLASRNGTYVDGESVSRVAIDSGARVTIAKDGPKVILTVVTGATTIPVQ